MALTIAAKILQIHRDRVKPGRERIYRATEEDAARICVGQGCPHPHLAIESLAAPMEVWWINAFGSEDHRQAITDAYLRNGPLMAAFAGIRQRREGLLDVDLDIFAEYKPELSRGQEWTVAGARFISVTITTQNDLPSGAVYDTSDGTRYVFTPAATELEASAAASRLNSKAFLFAVRPYWGMPAREWIAADPEFWKSSPAASLE